MARNFWKGKRVLVTGANGFVGSWLCKALSERGASIVGADVLSDGSFLERLGIRKDVLLEKIDINDKESLKEFFLQNSFDVCFHLAAKSIVSKIAEAPAEAIETNILGAMNVLEACRQGKIGSLIVASSSRVYTDSKKQHSEEDAIFGQSTYDATKASIDIMARNYAKTFGLKIAVTRCANTFGGNDLNFERIVPLAAKTCLLGKEIALAGDGSIEREFLYVKDSVSAYLALAENLDKKGISGEAFNFSSGEKLKVKKLAEKINSLCGAKSKIVFDRKSQAMEKEALVQRLSITKAKKLLGWKPKYSLEQGLIETVAWYENFFRKEGLQ